MSAIICREVFAGVTEGYALPTGEFVIGLREAAVLTGSVNLSDPSDPSTRRRVEAPESVRFPVLTVGTGRGLCMAGQGQGDDLRATWEYVEAEAQWFNRGPNAGERPTLYLPDGTLVIEPGGPDHPVEGWAGAGLDGQPVRIVRADHTRDLYEVTEVGPFAIGQNGISGIELQFNGQRYEVEPGDVHTIWAVLGPNGVLAITTRKLAQNETVCLWLDVNRIAELPPAQTKKPDPPKEPDPKPTDPPKEPTVPAFPFEPGFNPVPALEAFRATLRTPIQVPGVYDDRPVLLIGSCQIVGHGAGLLKKDGGTHTTLPDGTNVSQDWMEFTNGSALDFIGDGEDTATIQWSEAKPSQGTRVEVSQFFDHVPVDPPKPDTSAPAQLVGLADSIIVQMDAKFPGASKGDDQAKRDQVRRIAEQLALSVDPKFGVKRAAADRPQGRNAIAYGVTPLVGYILYTDPGGDRIPNPKVSTMAGQVFEAVTATDHLGLGKPDEPGGDPGGPKPPDGDLAALVAKLSADVLSHGSRLSAVERTVDAQGSQLTVGASRDAAMADRIAALEKGGGAGGGTGGTGGTGTLPPDLVKQIVAEVLKQLFSKLGQAA